MYDHVFSPKNFTPVNKCCCSRSIFPTLQGLAARYINRMTVEAFYQIYTMWASGQGLPEDDVAKASCFRRLYEGQWKCTLKMRTVSQHARPVCLKLGRCCFKNFSEVYVLANKE